VIQSSPSIETNSLSNSSLLSATYATEITIAPTVKTNNHHCSQHGPLFLAFEAIHPLYIPDLATDTHPIRVFFHRKASRSIWECVMRICITIAAAMPDCHVVSSAGSNDRTKKFHRERHKLLPPEPINPFLENLVQESTQQKSKHSGSKPARVDAFATSSATSEEHARPQCLHWVGGRPRSLQSTKRRPLQAIAASMSRNRYRISGKLRLKADCGGERCRGQLHGTLKVQSGALVCRGQSRIFRISLFLPKPH